jgi:hypothetical protein
MKPTLTLLAALLLAPLAPEAADSSSKTSGGNASAGSVELIADPDFIRGLRAADREGKEHLIAWNPGPKVPVWATAHHGSKSRVADTAYQSFPPGGFLFKDDRIWIAIHAPTHDADLILGLNAFREYDGRYRAAGDPWPHLYVSQRVSGPDGHLGTVSPSVAEMSRIDFAARVKLLYDRRNTNEGYNKRIHAAQFLLFFTIQNLSRPSPGYGDYYWFGIAFYDDRKPLTELHMQRDRGSEKKKGTDKFIYDIGIKPFTDGIVAEGKWVELRGDLLPHVMAGLREAWKQGYLSGSTALADYRVGSVVIGWEIPGLNDAAAAIEGLRAAAQLRPACLRTSFSTCTTVPTPQNQNERKNRPVLPLYTRHPQEKEP